MLINFGKMVCSLWIPIVYVAVIVIIIILFVRFAIKKKRVGMTVTLIMTALMIIAGIIYRTPHYIIDTSVENISKIEISETTITDKETLKEILDDLNSSEYKRTHNSGIGGHAEYSIRGYDESEKLLFHIEITDEQTVDTGLFWEKRVSGKLNLSLYQNIATEMKWKKFQKIYTLSMKNTGEDTSTATYLEIAERSKKLFLLLEENTDTFVMDAYNYQDIDGEGTPLYTMNNLSYPEEVDPNGKSICVSKNYFKYNPIQTIDGADLKQQIVYDDLTLNLLVPEKYKDMEKQIIEAYRDSFYFEKVTATNDYNQEAGIKELLNIPLESLNVNIIYVEDGQKYFTYRDDCAIQTDNYITDPIVRIYTSNTHCNYAHSYLSQWTYIYAEKDSDEEVYQEIFPYLEQCNAAESIQEVISVYEMYCNNIDYDLDLE